MTSQQTQIPMQATLPWKFQASALDFKSVTVTKRWDHDVSDGDVCTVWELASALRSGINFRSLKADIPTPVSLTCWAESPPSCPAALCGERTHDGRREKGGHVCCVQIPEGAPNQALREEEGPTGPAAQRSSREPGGWGGRGAEQGLRRHKLVTSEEPSAERLTDAFQNPAASEGPSSISPADLQEQSPLLRASPSLDQGTFPSGRPADCPLQPLLIRLLCFR
ncbi:hypothetical protein CB1_000109010 [Camelus ferus]|nr:hypothetical protein CB1_000109010 [Camelus ferus]